MAGAAGAAVAEEGPVTGPVPLTPIQRWWLSDDPVDPHHYNQSVLLEAREPVSAAGARGGGPRPSSQHHDALRLRVSRGEQGWEQRIVPFDGTAPFERVDLGGLPGAGARGGGDRGGRASAGEPGSRARARSCASCSSRCGPGGTDRLLVVVHHFAVDGVSWRILLDDLWSAYEARAARRAGGAARARRRRSSAGRDGSRSTRGREAVAGERAYWLSDARRGVRRLPVDHPEGANTRRRRRAPSACRSRRRRRRRCCARCPRCTGRRSTTCC